jgi:hypothetical protein
MLFLLAGCAHRLQFRVVDAGSGSGLADVKVKLQERRFSYFYRHLHEHAVGATDTNGMVTVDRVSSSDVLYFDAPSHRGTAAGLVGRGRVAFGPFPPVDVDTMWRDRREVSSDGIIVIPLLPK